MDDLLTTDPLSGAFPEMVETLVRQHHSIYPWIPPQGIYFEALAQRAFHLCGSPDAQIGQTAPNTPQHDLLVARERISLKTETGRGTREDRINITKLCTTERDPWEPATLVARAVEHMSRYNRMLMLRAIWPREETSIQYQLVEIPVALLR